MYNHGLETQTNSLILDRVYRDSFGITSMQKLYVFICLHQIINADSHSHLKPLYLKFNNWIKIDFCIRESVFMTNDFHIYTCLLYTSDAADE